MGRRRRGAREGGGVIPPRIFIHGTDIVDTGLIVLISGLFCCFPPGNYSAYALDNVWTHLLA